MMTLIDYIQAHPYISGATAFGVLKYLADCFISPMPAPMADSSASYKYWFKVLNRFAANLPRAKSTAVENSPNFIPAVENHIKKNGGANGGTNGKTM